MIINAENYELFLGDSMAVSPFAKFRQLDRKVSNLYTSTLSTVYEL
jgi:hypothetical protein